MAKLPLHKTECPIKEINFVAYALCFNKLIAVYPSPVFNVEV
jgi:hypothetical protein